MSTSLWAWTPKCDHGGCCGDCDLCNKWEDVLEDSDEEW